MSFKWGRFTNEPKPLPLFLNSGSTLGDCHHFEMKWIDEIIKFSCSVWFVICIILGFSLGICEKTCMNILAKCLQRMQSLLKLEKADERVVFFLFFFCSSFYLNVKKHIMKGFCVTNSLYQCLHWLFDTRNY